MNKDIAFSTDIQFLDAEPLENNPMLSKVKIRIAQTGKNRNMTIISKETLQSAAEKSLGLTPIVGYFNHYKGDFGEHGTQAVFDDLGNLVDIADTVAVGVIPENPTIYWEEDYLVTYGYLWTERYPEIQAATEGRPQSMELSPKHTIIQSVGDGYAEILETAFTGLCILGNDVPPCFEEASIKGVTYSYIAKDEEKGIDEDMVKFMKKLEFALKNNFEDDKFIVDEQGEEKNKEVRETITDAINTLDEVAEIETSENQDVIDDSITKLVDAETELAGEVKIIPANTDVEDNLQGEPSREDGVVSTETATYKSGNSLLKKNKTKEEREEEEMANKKKKEVVAKEVPAVEEEVVVEEQEVATEEAPAVEETPVAKEEVPAVEETVVEEAAVETQPVVDNIGGEKKPAFDDKEIEVTEDEGTVSEVAETKGVNPGSDLASEPKEGITPQQSPEDPFGEPQSTPLQEGIEGEGIAPGESEMVEPKRKTADDKRKEAVLGSISDEELSDHLIERVEEAEKVKENIAKLAGTTKEEIKPENVSEEVLEEGEVVATEEAPEEFTDEAEASEEIVEESTDEEALETEEVAVDEEEVATEDVETEEVPGEEATAEETPAVEEEAPEKEEEVIEETVETEEDKKKKKKDFSLDFKAIVVENDKLSKEVEALKAKVDELLVYKLDAELAEKEALLTEFNISNEAKEEIRSNFSLMTLEEIEQKAALTFYREMKELSFGQKASDNSVVFSLDNEVEKPTTGLQAVLEKAAAKEEK